MIFKLKNCTSDLNFGPELKIPNATNHLDGGLFAPMKMLLKIHRGIGIEMKKKLIIDYLENIGK